MSTLFDLSKMILDNIAAHTTFRLIDALARHRLAAATTARNDALDEENEALVEYVARALAMGAFNRSDSGTPPKWSDWRDEARDAIRALNSAPSGETVEAIAARETEERIVAWLRDRAEDGRPFGLYRGDAPGCALEYAADAIECREYLKTT